MSLDKFRAILDAARDNDVVFVLWSDGTTREMSFHQYMATALIDLVGTRVFVDRDEFHRAVLELAAHRERMN
ncbi:MAG TPA: hypothetical protein VD931_16370 [Baekduia sp.]|nr:hypothetical protein [Baekduia sp.]